MTTPSSREIAEQAALAALERDRCAAADRFVEGGQNARATYLEDRRKADKRYRKATAAIDVLWPAQREEVSA